MTDSETFEFPTSADGGIVIQKATENGRPVVRLLIVVNGQGNRITLTPHEGMGVACQLGGFSAEQGQKWNRQNGALEAIPGARDPIELGEETLN